MKRITMVAWFLLCNQLARPMIWLQPVVLLILVCLIFAFSQPAQPTVTPLAPTIAALWCFTFILVFWHILFMLSTDMTNGIIATLTLSHINLEIIAAIMIALQWITLALPSTVAFGIGLAIVNVPYGTIINACLAWLIAAPAIIAWAHVAVFGAIPTKHATIIALVVAMPWCLPVIIFATGWIMDGTVATLMILSAISLAQTALAPWVLAFCLKMSTQE